MFNIGGGELIVIMLLALIVLGPQRLPDAARQIGKAMGDLRRLSTGFQNEVRSAIDTADDPNRVAARRNVLAKEAPGGQSQAVPPSTTRRTTPLKASPAPPPGPAAPAGKKAVAKNGTPVKKATKASSKSTPKSTATTAKKKAVAKKPATKATATKSASRAKAR